MNRSKIETTHSYVVSIGELRELIVAHLKSKGYPTPAPEQVSVGWLSDPNRIQASWKGQDLRAHVDTCSSEEPNH